jgi:arginyl-tRNA synthetase
MGLSNTIDRLETPVNFSFGDYSTSIALKLAKTLKKNPIMVAEEIKKNLPENDLVEKIEVLKPGFLNFWLSKNKLVNELDQILLQQDSYGKNPGPGKEILLEFGQPNTHKIPHIGHLFSFIFGESLARILEFNANAISRLNYQGDVGPHVAKCLYQVINNKEKTQHIRNLNLEEKVKYLQLCYQEGSTLYENEDKKKEIDDLNKKIYNKDPEITALWQETRQWSIDYYKEFETKLGIEYDKYYYESETSQEGKEIVKKKPWFDF